MARRVVSGLRGILVCMAICQDCDEEMLTASSCTVSTLHIRGVPVSVVPYGREQEGFAGRGGRCGDCGVETGGFHHLGCDIAPCPRCGGQLISCGCPFDELGGEEDDGDYDIQERDADPVGGWRDLKPPAGLSAENPCPSCGSSAVIPILYGYPSPAMASLSEQGLVELAGCGFDGVAPSSRCRTCGHAWGLGMV